MSVLKADAYSNSVTKTWYYNTNTRTYKSSGTQSATVSLSGGASDRAHIGAAGGAFLCMLGGSLLEAGNYWGGLLVYEAMNGILALGFLLQSEI